MKYLFTIFTLSVLFITGGIHAQSTEECTVTINGQTVFVGPYGSRFEVRNLPAGPDLVRACLVCKSNDGKILYGQTHFFEIADNETFVILEDIDLSQTPPPTVRSIRASAETPVLTSLGQTGRVNVFAKFSDDADTEIDVSNRLKGTTYRTSNPEIATVSVNGFVTAVGIGRVFITAVNEGATAVTQIEVSPGDLLTTIAGFVFFESAPVEGAFVFLPQFDLQTRTDATGRFMIVNVPSLAEDMILVTATKVNLPMFFNGIVMDVTPVEGGISDAGLIALKEGEGDSDGDCISDVLEDEMGLNPALADSDLDMMPDGDEDFDGDGLSNCDEIVAGLSPLNADTDGDFLLDGEDLALCTDPFDPDSDDDDFTDKDEIDFASDPCDETSTPLDTPVVITLAVGSSFSILNTIDPPITYEFTLSIGKSFSAINTDNPPVGEAIGLAIGKPFSLINTADPLIEPLIGVALGKAFSVINEDDPLIIQSVGVAAGKTFAVVNTADPSIGDPLGEATGPSFSVENNSTP